MGSTVEGVIEPSRKDEAEGGNGSSDEGLWSVGGDAPEHELDQHASKITALWELGDEFAARKPAQDEAGAAEEGAWSASEPVEPSTAGDEPVEQSTAVDVQPPFTAPAEPAPPPASVPIGAGIEIAADFAADVARHSERPPKTPQPAPASVPPRRAVADDAIELPTSGNTRLFVFACIAALAAVALIAVVIGFSDSDAPPASAHANGTAAESHPPSEPVATNEHARPVPPTERSAPEAAATAQEPPPGLDPPADPPAPAVVAPAPEPPPPAVVAPEPEPPAPVIAPPPPAPPPPTTAHLVVRTVPANATLTLDGHAVANPYEGEAPISSRQRFDAHAEGFRDATRTVHIANASAEDVELRLMQLPPPRVQPPPRVAHAPAPRPVHAPPPRVAHAEPHPRPAHQQSNTSAHGSGFVTDNPY